MVVKHLNGWEPTWTFLWLTRYKTARGNEALKPANGLKFLESVCYKTARGNEALKLTDTLAWAEKYSYKTARGNEALKQLVKKLMPKRLKVTKPHAVMKRLNRLQKT